jgi:hypothetical protein
MVHSILELIISCKNEHLNYYSSSFCTNYFYAYFLVHVCGFVPRLVESWLYDYSGMFFTGLFVYVINYICS